MKAEADSPQDSDAWIDVSSLRLPPLSAHSSIPDLTTSNVNVVLGCKQGKSTTTELIQNGKQMGEREGERKWKEAIEMIEVKVFKWEGP